MIGLYFTGKIIGAVVIAVAAVIVAMVAISVLVFVAMVAFIIRLLLWAYSHR